MDTLLKTRRIRSINDFEELKDKIMLSLIPEAPCIVISCGTCGQARGALKVVEAFKNEIKKQFVGASRRLVPTLRITGCHGFCEVEPNVIIEPDGIFYVRLKPEDAEVILQETIINKRIIDRLLYVDPVTHERIVYEKDIPFYKSQQRIVSSNNSKIDPTRIDNYIAIGGYGALCKVLKELVAQEVIDTVKQSGLRGRGGQAFRLAGNGVSAGHQEVSLNT